MLWLMRRYCSIFGHAYGRIIWDQDGRRSVCDRCGKSIYHPMPIRDAPPEGIMSSHFYTEIDGHKVVVESLGDAIFLRFEGYGTHVENEGWLIRIDFHHGYPIVYIWGDIRQEDPTHMISLEQALEVVR